MTETGDDRAQVKGRKNRCFHKVSSAKMLKDCNKFVGTSDSDIKPMLVQHDTSVGEFVPTKFHVYQKKKRKKNGGGWLGGEHKFAFFCPWLIAWS